MKYKHKKKSTLIPAILLVVFAVLLAYSGTMLAKELTESKEAEDEFESLSELVTSGDAEDKEPAEEKPGNHISDETDTEDKDEGGTGGGSGGTGKSLPRDIPKLVEMNPDCVGWIFVDGTPINYPVVHTPKEPEKYLRKSFYGKKSTGGVPFIDYRCTLKSTNVIVYGHGMRNGTMFGKLKNYLKKSFWEKHDIIEFETLSGCTRYRIFAVMQVKNNDAWYSKISLSDENSFNRAITYAKEHSKYDTGLTPHFGQSLISLSTCYGDTKSDRLIVVGAKIE